MQPDAYDVSEMAVLDRMKKIMRDEDDLTDEDFEDCSFIDIESMFLDEFGHEDFRPADDEDEEPTP